MARHYRASGVFLAGGDRWRFGDGEMKTRAEYDAEIARLQAERDALPPEVDLSEAVEAYCNAYIPIGGTYADGLRAAYPHLHKALGAPEPRCKVPAGQTPLNDDLGHRLLDVFNEGMRAFDEGTSSPYHGHSLEHCIHAAGWVQRDLRVALDKAQSNVAPEPSEEDDKQFAWEVCVDAGYSHPHSREHHLALAAIRAERARARGEKA